MATFDACEGGTTAMPIYQKSVRKWKSISRVQFLLQLLLAQDRIRTFLTETGKIMSQEN